MLPAEIWEKVKRLPRYLWDMFLRLDNYNRAVLCILPVVFGLLLFVLIVCPGDLMADAWFMLFITIPGFASAQMAAGSYLGRVVDYLYTFYDQFLKAKTKNFLKRTASAVQLTKKNVAPNVVGPIGPWEQILTTLMGGLGLAIGISLAVIGTTVPLGGHLFFVAKIIFALAHMTRFAGLGNRLGTILDHKNNQRLGSEKALMGTAMIIGLGLSLLLVALGATALVGVAGVTTFPLGGVTLPLWLAGFIFIVSFTSSLASTADFGSKGINFIRYYVGHDDKVINAVRKRKHEYRGAFCGLVAGIGIGLFVTIMFAIAQPHLFVGMIGLISAAFIITTSVALIGGLCGRTGRLIDGFYLQEKPLSRAPSPELLATPANDHKRRPSKDARATQPLIPSSSLSAPAADHQPAAATTTSTLVHRRSAVTASDKTPNDNQRVNDSLSHQALIAKLKREAATAKRAKQQLELTQTEQPVMMIPTACANAA